LDLDEENATQENTSTYVDNLREQSSISNDESNKKENDSLFNNYLLNEIKAQDDAIKHVMSISGLLIGAYATVMVSSIGKISLDLLNSTSWISLANIRQDTTRPSLNIFYLILLFPLVFWFVALAISVMNLSPSSNKLPFCELSSNIFCQLDKENFIKKFLIEIAQRKYRTYKISSLIMVMGLMTAIVIAMLSMPIK
jgi:urea transporter